MADDLTGRLRNGVAAFPFKGKMGQVVMNGGAVTYDIGSFRWRSAGTLAWRGWVQPTGPAGYSAAVGPFYLGPTGSTTCQWYCYDIYGEQVELLVLYQLCIDPEAEYMKPGFYDSIDGNKAVTIDLVTDGARLVQWSGSAINTAISSSDALGLTSNAWMWLRMRREGTTYYYRRWYLGEPEPRGWTGSGTSSGYVGAVTHPSCNFRSYLDLDEANIAWFSAAAAGKRAPSQYPNMPMFGLADVPEDTRILSMPEPNEKQPTTFAEVDWTNPITKGLVVAIPFNEGSGRPREAVSGRIMTGGTGSPTWTAGPDGHAFNGASAAENAFTLSDVAPSSGSVVSCAHVVMYSGAAVASFLTRYYQPSNARGWEFVFDGWTASQVYVGVRQNWWGSPNGSLWTPPASKWITYVGTNGPNHGLRCYGPNGLLIQNSSQVTDDVTNGSAHTISIDAAATHYGQMVSLWWNRELSEAEALSIQKNAWQVFVPTSLVLPFNEELPNIVRIDLEWDREP